MSEFFRTQIDREEIPSTSDLARELVLAGEVALPIVVRARRQTAGRGRGDHRWWSDEGSLTFTVAIDPAFHGLRREHEPRLALAVAVGMIEALESRFLAPGTLSIRWPNDVEAGGKKLAGILPERIETDSGARLLVGLGLNVSPRLDEAPADIRAMATSLRTLGATEAWCDAAFDAILGTMPAVIDRLARDDPSLAGAWLLRDVLFGEPVRLFLGTETIGGRGAGIDRDGALVVEGPNGRRTFFGGQVLRPLR